MLYYRTRYYTLPHIRVVLQSFNKLAMRVSSWSQLKKKKKKKKKSAVVCYGHNVHFSNQLMKCSF